ncbi:MULTISPECIES: glycosyltransferase [unclassified Rhodococcus (in: high G+C Gram-positive bacteria)]|uniref:glycosyltransferase n=1 Tax=unclassified Rhodococcus (in: high G+C Gram-positive bacteria) TaxID=192944 RepID=UPI0021BE0419|nr:MULTISPECIES: glycosyltransferase [unclassified Rhodococcus (in: high G+C Gram-positive bacteria)]
MTPTVVAVVTAFDPSSSLLDTCDAVAPQVSRVVVVDDGSPGDVSALLEDCRRRGHLVLESAVNSGIAHALNRGVEAALREGADAVLTLDQDTVVADDYVRRAVDHLILARSLGLDEVMLSTATMNGLVAPFWFAEKGLTLAFEPIQSGMVVTRSLFDAVGLFDEGLFIDCVETEFYLRARAHGAHALVVPGTSMTHSIGRPMVWAPRWPVRLALRRSAGRVEFHGDAAFRHYYIMRNRWILYRRYARREPLWCVVSVLKDTLARGGLFLMGDHRLARVHLTLSGLRAGMRGETGKIPDRVLRRARLG